jgi:hypothetical protein
MMKKSRKRPLPRPFKMPWGDGVILEEAAFKGRWHEPTIQFMKYENGSSAIRFAHYRGGGFQRSPLIIDTKDLKKLKKSIDRSPELKRALKMLVG